MEEFEKRRQDLIHYQATVYSEAELARRFAPGSFGSHEAVDRLSLMIEHLDKFVIEHPTVIARPDVFEKVYKAMELLTDSYSILSIAESYYTALGEHL